MNSDGYGTLMKYQKNGREMVAKNASMLREEEFWTLYEGGPPIDKSMATSVEGLMKAILPVARFEMRSIGKGRLGCNFAIQTSSGDIRFGDFNPEGVSSNGGNERAGTILVRLLRELGAVRYVFYTEIKPVNPSQRHPDIGVIGCEDGVKLAYIYKSEEIINGKYKPILMTDKLEAWFVGLLDSSTKMKMSVLDRNEMESIGVAGAKCMKVGKMHILSDAKTIPGGKKLQHSLIFEGVWRANKGVFEVKFNDSIYSEKGGMMTSILLGSVLLGAKASTACVILSTGLEEKIQHGFRPVKQHCYLACVKSCGKLMFEGWLSSVGGKDLTMKGGADKWWTEASINKGNFAHSLIELAFDAMDNEEDETEEEHEHGLKVAESKLKEFGFSFVYHPDSSIASFDV